MSPDKEKEKEAARAAKAAKFAAKQAKAAGGAQQKGQGPTASASASAGASAGAGAGAGAAPARPSKAQAPALPPYVDETPPGEKKLVQPLDHDHFKAYNPQAVESAWYAWWEKSGFFQPRPGAGPDKFVIPLPPPNVTGALHCGHALANSLQDTLIRWYRMRGFSTLWVPGCDHAGIATQSVVEKMLWKRERKTRHDLGRTEFTRVVWKWKEEYHQRINQVQRLMGGSMDWTREAFTMDERRTAATMEAFCRLHEEGYIYRSDRLVNWCSSLQTALSTLEVENREIDGRTMLDVPGYDKKIEFGIMTYFNYPIDGCAAGTTIQVATTRPETLFGDTGIAVHPDDKRYAHLVGKFARHPFTDRLLKIVADTYADPELGTGAVKLTPAHDPNDYQVGQRHGLDLINILNDDGTLNANAGPRFAGKRRFDARYAVVEELTKLGLFVKKEPHAMKIPLCEKTKDVIEPRMKKQWWVKMQGMAEEALRVVEEGQISIKPESAHRSYQRWMSSITDWCISRQLWWGHRIPAYRVIPEAAEAAEGAERAGGANGADSSAEHDETIWVVGRTPEEAQARAEAKLPAGQPFRLERDPDCLDTWFSSGLWPLSTLGWPEIEGADFKTFFPTSLLETGWDILFFWVARMIMLSVKLTGQVPFTEVYCHSLIRDSEGRKMSKSLGNVIDPVDVISGIDLEALHAKLLVGNLKEDEVSRATKYQKTAFPNGIPECGADALRFTLLSYATGGGDINFDINVMAAYRRFCNKIWQATKYVLGRLPPDFAPAGPADGGAGARLLSLPEKWILHRMNQAVRGINDALAGREFSRSTQFAYQFFYDELCDVFIENSKGLLSDGSAEEQQESVRQTLYQALDVALRLLHPLMPFITEELWQRLPRGGQGPESVMLAPYPTFDPELDFAAEAADYELGLRCAGAARSLASDFNMRTGGHVLIRASTEGAHAKIAAQLGSIQTLCGKTIGKVELLPGGSGGSGAEPGGCAVHVVSADVVVFLAVADLIKDVEAEIKKIQTKLDKTRAAVAKQQQLIAKDGFEDKTSDSVRAAERKKLEDAQAAVGNYERTIFEFSKLRIDS